ncbi:phosphopantetheine-binding protein [Pseudomonas sp. P97.38]|uniref:phosphopantetheine-binding protein n=1 Tax=Pseudomonas sp. P97.38 TaxID=255451 RepID=UPI003529781F
MESRIIELFSGYFLKAEKISGCSRLIEDLNADSMDFVELAMIVDEVFELVLAPSEIAGWRTVSDVISTVENNNMGVRCAWC